MPHNIVKMAFHIFLTLSNDWQNQTTRKLSKAYIALSLKQGQGSKSKSLIYPTSPSSLGLYI